jgi:hypothetical protein
MGNATYGTGTMALPEPSTTIPIIKALACSTPAPAKTPPGIGDPDHRLRPGRAVGKLMESALKPIDALFSLIDPPKTPRQLRKEAIKARIDREAQAERNADLSNFLAERAQERRNEQERQAARDRERGDRER